MRATAPGTQRLRCAIYTRKSSEEGLEQSFNSLHAQREACEAYVLSQAGEGWSAITTPYDDGGFSGGSMERPGLKDLMADIEAGRIDVVVVYKVDRLTRSLADFAKIVERFDAKGVSFVSVTQAFNTTTSMGRLTLNVLLSFAQFEREVTGERIRDKIAASKKKGLWMGGSIPLGYDPQGRVLVVNKAEAEQVRHIFHRYLELGSVHVLMRELQDQGIRSKQRTTLAGRRIGGEPFGRGALFYLLSNRHYLGQIVHKDQCYPGQHPAIVASDTFEAVQQMLAKNAGPERRAKVGLAPLAPASPLCGLIYDDAGNRMTAVSARKGRGRLYRYYVSTAVQQGRQKEAGSLARTPAAAIEDLVTDRLQRLELQREALVRVEVGKRRVIMSISAELSNGLERRLPESDRLEPTRDGIRVIATATVQWRGGSKAAIGPSGMSATETKTIDLPLLKGLVAAEALRLKLEEGRSMNDVADEAGLNRAYAQRLVRLAWLSPPMKRAILDGTTPQGFALKRLLQEDIPLAWDDQRRWRSQ
jgi:site-specific DNA recombinase